MNTLPESQAPTYVVRQVSPETEGAANTALWLEIIFGLFSLLGLGHVYSGRTWLGIALMIAWWVYIPVASVLTAITFGFGACLFIPLYIAVPIISGIQAKMYVQKTGGRGNWASFALVGAGGCLVVIFIVVALVALGVITSVVSQYNTR